MPIDPHWQAIAGDRIAGRRIEGCWSDSPLQPNTESALFLLLGELGPKRTIAAPGRGWIWSEGIVSGARTTERWTSLPILP